jgi:hypothetical protein
MRQVSLLLTMLSLSSLLLIGACAETEAELPPVESTTVEEVPVSRTRERREVEVQVDRPEVVVQAPERPRVVVQAPERPTVVVQPPARPTVVVQAPRPPSITVRRPSPPSVEVR